MAFLLFDRDDVNCIPALKMPGPQLLIDEFLPSFNFSERHSLSFEMEASKVYDAVINLNFESSGLTKLLLRLRGLPSSTTSLQELQQMGFILLGQRPKIEVVLGVAGKFWTPSGCIQFLTPTEFLNFKTSGYAKAVWNFVVTERAHNSSSLSTETRILCLGRASLQYFRLYWFFVRPFSSIIRRSILRAIKHQVEGFEQ